MAKSLKQIAEGILKGETLLEDAVPQEPMHSIAKDEKDKDEQGEQDLGARIDTPRGKATSGPATAGKGVAGRAQKRPADNTPDNEPMHTIPDPDEDSEGPEKFPKRPADASSKQDDMKSLPDTFTTKGKGPKNVDESKKNSNKKVVDEDEADIEANNKKVQSQIRYEDVTSEDFNLSDYVNLDEDMAALFNGEQLSEAFKEKAKTIYEAAVNAKVNAFQSQLIEAFEEQLAEEIEKIEEDISKQVDDHLNYVVEQWLVDNEVAIESGLRTELTEDFITGLRALFLENYIDVPEEEVSVIGDLAEKVQELEDRVNEEIENNVTLKQSLNETTKEVVFLEATRNLTETQVEKLRELSEGVEFTSVEQFSNKLEMIYENYYPEKSGNKPTLDEVGETNSSILAEDVNTKIPTKMSKYTSYLSKVAGN